MVLLKKNVKEGLSPLNATTTASVEITGAAPTMRDRMNKNARACVKRICLFTAPWLAVSGIPLRKALHHFLHCCLLRTETSACLRP